MITTPDKAKKYTPRFFMALGAYITIVTDSHTLRLSRPTILLLKQITILYLKSQECWKYIWHTQNKLLSIWQYEE